MTTPVITQSRVNVLFAVHVLITCAAALFVASLFWAGTPIYTVSTGADYEYQFAISLLVAVVITWVAVRLVKQKKRQINFKPWMLHLPVALLYFYAAFSLLEFLIDWRLALGLGILFGAGFFVVAEKKSDLMAIFTAILSVIMVFPIVISLPLAFILVASGAYAAYDIYTVFYGPLRMLAKYLTVLRYSGLGTPLKGRFLGLGDSVFYALFFSSVYLNLGPLPGIFSLIGIVSGFLLTFSLAKSRPMPALPLSVALGFGMTLLGLVM